MTTLKIYPAKPERVYFFATCLVDLFYPDAGLAGMDLLKRENIQVDFPLEQTCCGQPAFTSGYTDEARNVAKQQLSLFPESIPIVVPSGSCAGMMRVHYPKLFAGTEYETLANQVASRVYELTEFLLYVCKVQLIDQGEPIQLAIHTSCSARRELGLGNTALQLVSQLKQVEVKEQQRITECCGFGGTFAVRHPEISGAMVEDKVNTLQASGAECFVTGDCGCLMNIQGAADKQSASHLANSHSAKQDSINGEHIASFLWRRTHV